MKNPEFPGAELHNLFPKLVAGVINIALKFDHIPANYLLNGVVFDVIDTLSEAMVEHTRLIRDSNGQAVSDWQEVSRRAIRAKSIHERFGSRR